MNANPNPKRAATPELQPIQTALQFESREADRRIPSEKKSECIALICELIEVVTSRPKPQAGGSNE